MHLKTLELCGFKSFADRTRVVFERGLTAIVGPNGCGKSNIVDAIRWALGEQSARQMRGAAMADLIFNGGGRRGPLQTAEVTLTFENEDRALAIEKDEIRVTRRLHRSGDSEYLLNGKPCRLRDIRELLLDTGAGASAATFVEQGKIDALLHASPEERRHVLEEAAGIGKFKIRKREALERLDEVTQDRGRLGDVLSEVIARHEEVKKQAEKAAKYRGLRDRWRDLRLLSARHKKASLERKAEEARVRGLKLLDERAALEKSISGLLAEVEAIANEKREAERAIRTSELELRDLVAAERARKEQAEQEARRAAECQDDLARIERAKVALEAKKAALEKEIASGKSAAEEQSHAEKGLGKRLDELEARARTLEAQVRDAQAEVEKHKTTMLTRMQAEANLRNRAGELDAKNKVLAGREDRLTRKRAEVAAALAEKVAHGGDLERRAKEAEERAKALDAELREAQQRREETEREIREAEEAFLEARKKTGDVEARIAALASLDREGQDLEPGVRAVLEAGGPEVIGPLGDALGVAREHSAAIEAALGPRAQWVLVKTREAAIGIARWLAKAEKGRAHLVAIDGDPVAARHPASSSSKGALEKNGFVGWAADLAKPDAAAKPLVARVLERIAIVKDLDAALAIASLPAIEGCVTLAGDVVTAAGIEAGKRKGLSRIERRSEKVDLEKKKEEQNRALQLMRADLERLKSVEREAASDVERLRSQANEARLSSFGLKRDREELDRLLARFREEERLTEIELADVTADRKDAQEGLVEVEAKLAEMREGAGDHEKKASESAASLRALEVDRATVREELGDLRVKLARGAEQWEAMKKAAARAERELEENRKSRESLSGDEKLARERMTEARGSADRFMAEALRLSDEKKKREAQLEGERTTCAALTEKLESRKKEEAGALEARTKAEQGVVTCEREEREAKGRLDELAERVREDLQVEISTLEAPPEGKFNESATDREVTSLRKQMEDLGPVNLEALDECDRLAERRTFLGTQMGDLEKAEEALRSTIKKINETSRKRFTETFEAVRENFKDIFRRLFGGGKADLVLEEGKDVLEAGVDVHARPPGKEARTISLLSGGEKTLATVALLFAVFRTKPGPFCVLDEVDAALDEHNVGRFVALVRDFLDRSQFLIISHNKKTMAAADALYGVTMPEPGVSAPVSVRLGVAGQAAAQAQGQGQAGATHGHAEPAHAVAAQVPAGAGAEPVVAAGA